ncbi:hypothetical protein ACP4OV_003457 [Aristida adscensionis]
MERKGGCCLAPRYTAAAGGTGQAWQMGRIMLKFRPIAPKPAAMAPVPSPSPSPAPAPAAAAGRGKRKAAAGGAGRRGRKPKKAATVVPAPAPAAVKTTASQKESDKDKSLSDRSSSSSGMTSVDSSPPPPPTPPAPTTLPLMPVLPAEEKQASAASTAAAPSHAAGGELAVAPRAARPAATSWVTVEAVTATWRDGEAPSTATTPWAGDDEAPAFVSDQWGRVTWTNAAFSRAVLPAAADVEVRVGLAANLGAAAVPAWGTCAGFTCRVRVRGGGGAVVAPCDVWRLDAGGCYLWRLDLQAALTLGGGLP